MASWKEGYGWVTEDEDEEEEEAEEEEGRGGGGEGILTTKGAGEVVESG